MNDSQRQETRRLLASMSPTSQPFTFLLTPDDGRGEAALLVARQRIDPRAKLDLMKSGATRFATGTLTKTDEGFLVFHGGGLNAKRLDAIVAKLSDGLPILEGATVG